MSGGAFLGTSDFAARVLRRLAGSDHRPSLVVTLPDSRRGRGRKVRPSPVAEEAGELGIELMKSPDVNEPSASRQIVEASAATGWSSICAFGQLIREPLLTEAPMLNVHPSLLPRWRGAAPIERAIMAGDRTTGVSVMRLVAGLDSGPVAIAEAVEIGPEEDFGSLSARLSELGGDLLVEALDRAVDGRLEWTEQDDAAATYAEKVGGDERRLDPGVPAVRCHDLVRALTPHIGAWLGLGDGGRLGVVSTRVESGRDPGQGVVEEDSGRLFLGCADQAIELLEVRPEGRTTMDARAYLSGYGVPVVAAP